MFQLFHRVNAFLFFGCCCFRVRKLNARSSLAYLFSRFAKEREREREREKGFGKTIRGNQFKSNVYDVS